jgi:hypothetical protein
METGKQDRQYPTSGSAAQRNSFQRPYRKRSLFLFLSMMKPSTVCISFSPATTISKLNKTRGLDRIPLLLLESDSLVRSVDGGWVA